ncbi:MAG TPA: 16S rRNA (uracil(1498)-N(3))-methyltransferase [Nitrospira sp.]|nr:16S rRNA (uracil(1498)-N(3))-methyltransferase [Nitrospira sp.]
MPTFFVPSEAVAPPTIRITGDLLHHLRESLRLHTGEALTVTDDRGIRYRTEIVEVTAKQLVSRILETTTPPAKTGPSLVLAQALLKGEKMDWVIQKATELGVDRIIPVYAARSVVKLRADRTEHQLARWQRIALEAAQQSERWSVPKIEEPSALSQLATGDRGSFKIILAERSNGASLQTISLPAGRHDTILPLIGAEGGWSEDELRVAQAHGYTVITLGSRILRAETAAIAAISILQSRLGGLG